MLKRHIILVVVTLHTSINCLDENSRNNNISGALLGAVIGDAFGQLTSALGTYKTIVGKYGHNGVNSVSQLKQGDWFVDTSGSKKMPYTRNTMISSASCALLAQMRSDHGMKEQFVSRLARSIQIFYGEMNVSWNACFTPWYAAKKVTFLEKEPTERTQCFYWASEGTDMRSYYGCQQEADSNALSRVWPVGVVYSDDLAAAQHYADYCTAMTHTHPTPRAAAAAYVTGLALLLQGETISAVVDSMVLEAEKFDRLELLCKKNAVKILSTTDFKAELVAQNRMLTSDLIRYAVWLAQEGKTPQEVFGSIAKKQESNRSFRGFLLGFQADEAVAASVYLLIRNSQSMKNLIADGSLACGNTALISSLAGALLGAHLGLEAIKQEGFAQEIQALENSERLAALSLSAGESLRMPSSFERIDSKNPIVENPAAYYDLNSPQSSNGSFFNKLLLFGGAALGLYLIAKN